MSEKEIDHAIRTTFRNPPILASEDRALYEDLKRLVLSDIKPLGLQETLLARDIVEAEWEVCRLRWMKVATLHAVLLRVIKSRILEAGGTRSLDRRLVPKICKHVAAVVAGDPQARQQLETLLENYKLTVDLIVAAAFDIANLGVSLDRDALANLGSAELDDIARKRVSDIALRRRRCKS